MRSANSPQEAQQRSTTADDVQRAGGRVPAGQTQFSFSIDRAHPQPKACGIVPLQRVTRDFVVLGTSPLPITRSIGTSSSRLRKGKPSQAPGHHGDMDILATLVTVSPVLLPLVSALAGVLAGGLLSRSNEKSKRLGELKREIILESLDQAYAMEDAMSTFTSNAPFGGSDPEADSRAGEAIGRVTMLGQEMRRMRGRVSVIGSQTVIDSFERFDKAIHDYMNEVARQMNADGVFRGAEARKFLDRYSDALDEYVNQARRLLGVNGRVNSRHRRSFDALQVD